MVLGAAHWKVVKLGQMKNFPWGKASSPMKVTWEFLMSGL